MDLKFNYEEFFNKIDKIENIESIIYKQTSGFDLYLLCTFCSKFFELICEDKINRIKYSDLDISFSGKKFGFDEDEFAFLNDCSILHYNSYYLENKKLIKKKIYIKFELIEVVDINYFNCLYNSLYLIERIILNNTKPENSEPIQKVEIEPEAIDLIDTSTTDKYLGQPTNENANKFFEFLCEYYRPEDKTQVKYVNILYYLKNDAEKKHFIYKVKQKDYKKLIESKGITISKFDKSTNYLEVEKPIFYTLENTFLKNKTV